MEKVEIESLLALFRHLILFLLGCRVPLRGPMRLSREPVSLKTSVTASFGQIQILVNRFVNRTVSALMTRFSGTSVGNPGNGEFPFGIGEAH